MEVHTAVVDVPDPRVDRLSAIFKPKKTIYTKVTYADIAGLDGSAGKSGISGTLLNQLPRWTDLSTSSAFLRMKTCPTRPAASIPQRDIETMDSEFILNDLIAVERKLERLTDERRKGGGRDKASSTARLRLFERMREALNQEIPLRDIDISAEEDKILSGFGFLSRKPV
jgi:ribosome-binding ATPase